MLETGADRPGRGARAPPARARLPLRDRRAAARARADPGRGRAGARRRAARATLRARGPDLRRGPGPPRRARPRQLAPLHRARAHRRRSCGGRATSSTSSSPGVADGVTAQAPDGSLIYANDAAVETLGYEQRRGAAAAPRQRDHGPLRDVRRGRRAVPARAASRGASRSTGEKPEDAVVRFRVPRDRRGALVGREGHADPRRQTATVLMAINVFEDITEHKESELRARFLADAADGAGRARWTTRPRSSRWPTWRSRRSPTAASSSWPTHDGQLAPVAMAHRDREQGRDIMRELRERVPRRASARRAGVGHVFRTGDSELYAELDPPTLRRGGARGPAARAARGAWAFAR